MTDATSTARATGPNPTQAINHLRLVVASDLWAGWVVPRGLEPIVREIETLNSGGPAYFEATIGIRLPDAWPDPPRPPRPDTHKRST